MDEKKVNNRLKALVYYYKGQECITKNEILRGITHFKSSLTFLIWATEEETTEKQVVHTSDIQSTLGALVNALNLLILFYPRFFTWPQVLKGLEKSLTFYVGAFDVLNKDAHRLPWLTELNLKELATFLKKSSSPSEQGRAEICMATISIFHEGLESARTYRTLPGDDAAVKKIFALYEKAKILVPEVVDELLPVVVQAVVAIPVIKVVKPVLASQVPKFDQFATPEKKRADIVLLMEMKKYDEVVKRSEHIFNRLASDYRQACQAYYEIGNAHVAQNNFQKALESYKNALLQCKHIEKPEVSQVDQDNLAKVFTAWVKALDEITRDWSDNFGEASKSLADILSFYLNYFDTFHHEGKKLPGWDEMDIDNLMPFLSEIGAEKARKITKIYLVIIAMFRQDAKLEEGQLLEFIEEIKNEISGNDKEIIASLDLFQKALTLVESTKYQQVLNPELQAAPQPHLKRRKNAYTRSSSSSSLPLFGLESRVATAGQDRQDPPTGPLRTYSRK